MVLIPLSFKIGKLKWTRLSVLVFRNRNALKPVKVNITFPFPLNILSAPRLTLVFEGCSRYSIWILLISGTQVFIRVPR